jgi:hypothetical protein
MKHALDNPQVSFFKSQTHKINLSNQSMRSRVFRIGSTGLGSCSPSVTRTHDSKQENYFCAGKFVFLEQFVPHRTLDETGSLSILHFRCLFPL